MTDGNFLIAASALIAALCAAFLDFWLVARWRYLGGGESKKAKEAAECSKTWGMVGAIIMLVVVIVLTVLLAIMNFNLLSAPA